MCAFGFGPRLFEDHMEFAYDYVAWWDDTKWDGRWRLLIHSPSISTGCLAVTVFFETPRSRTFVDTAGCPFT